MRLSRDKRPAFMKCKGKYPVRLSGVMSVMPLGTCLFFLLLTLCGSAPPAGPVPFCVVSYNVENLFDCRHDSSKNDVEFLPGSARRWNYAKYKKKLDDVSRVIVAAGGWNLPALVGLCEVENDRVLADLTRHSALEACGYSYVMTHSADERGIDVALLYRENLFRPLFHQELKVPQPPGNSRPTRDILHVGGRLLNGDTLDVFVCHFPSRYGGGKLSEPYRISAASRLKRAVDSVMQERGLPQVIIMGDFNDCPGDASVELLLHEDEGRRATGLHHLLKAKAESRADYGSYKYRGWWGLLDHLIVSANMLDADAPLHVERDGGEVVSLPFLLAPDRTGRGMCPYRTFIGPEYQGGYSDHLPVRAVFSLHVDRRHRDSVRVAL